MRTDDPMIRLAEAIDRSDPFIPLENGPHDEASAYRLQDDLVAVLENRPGWGPVAGYKIAANDPRLMEALGLSEPLWGRIFQGRVWQSGQAADVARFTDLRIEAEIALILAAPPVADATGRFTPEAIRRATRLLRPGVELIDMRGATRESISLHEAVAHNISNIGAVIRGPGIQMDQLDLSAIEVRVLRGADVLAKARGTAPQDPFEAVAWLANRLAARGRELRAEQFVLCGTFTDMIRVNQGDRITVELLPLGRVDMRL